MSNYFTQMPKQHVLVTGGTGFIGSELVKQLLAAGHQVTILSRKPAQAVQSFGQAPQLAAVADFAQIAADAAISAVVNLAGSPVVGPRWSAARKQVLRDSRVGTTQRLNAWLAQAAHKPAVLVNGSAIGYYGCRGDEALDENAGTQNEFMSDLCREWEEAAVKAEALGVRVVRLRLGLVFGPGGAFPKLLLPFKLGVGGRMGDGRQVMSWVHRNDVLAVIARAIANPTMSRAYNMTAPHALTQAEFAALAAKLLHRPNLFVTPACVLELLLGEMAALFTKGQRVVPKRLLDEGYQFEFATLEAALRDELG